MLLIAEVIAPGFFLMFIGAAAIATGLLSLVLPVGVPLQLAIFAILAIIIVRMGGRRAYASRYDHTHAIRCSTIVRAPARPWSSS